MKTPNQRCKCLHCNEYSLPNYRSGTRQRFCVKPQCRKVRRQQSQKAWLAKPENQNYFRDARNAERVRDWQKAHPGYWKNTARYRRRTLQDGCSEQVLAPQPVVAHSPSRTLQDLCTMHVPLLVGLISMFVGSTLPDDIAASTRRLLVKGHDILGMVPSVDVEKPLHEQTCPPSGAAPENPAALQLDRSPIGPGKLLRPV